MSASLLRWSSLQVGAELELATRTYTPLELFLFSAAGWHPHRIHYDHPYATAVEGHRAVVVHGPLQAVHIVDALLEALDVDVTVRSLAYRHRALLTVGESTVVSARTESVTGSGQSATFEVWMARADDGEPTTTVTVAVERLSLQNGSTESNRRATN